MPRNLPIPPHNQLENGNNHAEMIIPLQDGSDEIVSIIICHRNRVEYLSILLQSIVVTSLNNNYEIIVVDNGSTGQDADDYLNEISESGEVKVIRNEKNEWMSEAFNKGARAANKNSKYFVFMHCDVVILDPCWLDLLISVSETGSGMVGVSLASYYLGNQKVDYIEEFLVLVTRECYEKITWNPELPMMGNSFMFTQMASTKGFSPKIIKNNIAHHFRVFALDYSQFEVLQENCISTLQRLMREMQTGTKK